MFGKNFSQVITVENPDGTYAVKVYYYLKNDTITGERGYLWRATVADNITIERAAEISRQIETLFPLLSNG